MSTSSVEIILLDFRHFLDEALTFIEFYESGERDTSGKKFTTNREEISKLRKYTIEFSRLVFDLKKVLQSNDFGICDFNRSFAFSEHFRNKKDIFYNTMFKRLEVLSQKIFHESDFAKNDLMRVYFKLIQKQCKKSYEFIGYLESNRWNRSISIEILDKLLHLSNEFSCVYQKFVQYLEAKNQVYDTLLEAENKNANCNSVPKKQKQKKSSTSPNCEIKNTSMFDSISSYFLDLKDSRSKYFTEKNRRICPCFALILILFVSLILFAFILPILRHFLNRNSNIYAVNLKDEKSFYENLQDNKFDFLNIIDLPSLFNGIKDKDSRDEIKKFAIQFNGKTNFWMDIFSYMKEFYVVFLSLSAFLSIEWFIK